MKSVQITDFGKLFKPSDDSHKGQNGRLMIIGGSHLFHAASLWSLTVASRIVDLVHYSSVFENNEIVAKAKEEFRNGIVVSRGDIEAYIEEDDCILIGPGMMRSEDYLVGSSKLIFHSIKDIQNIENEGQQTEVLTNYLLKKYPNKQWVIDAGALQMVNPELIPKNAILTPHHKEFEKLYTKFQNVNNKIPYVSESMEDKVKDIASKLNCIVLLKGHKDIICSSAKCLEIEGGNAGMTKGGTGDVLAGLVAALACKNDPFLATSAGSYINKKAADGLFNIVGPYFNASDLANEIPKTIKSILYE